MGYQSIIRTTDALISIPEVDEKEREVDILIEKLREAASDANVFVEVHRKPNAHKLEKEINEWLQANRDNVGHFLQVDAQKDFLQVKPTGAEGKAYHFEDDLIHFIRYIKSLNLVLSGTFYREGSSAGDVERFIVKENELVAQEKARLVFSDATEYEG